jgi:hypothetical protein
MKIKGSCHCKATVFEVSHAPETVTSCTCSFCSKRGALLAYYSPADVYIIKDEARAFYEWRTKTAKHNFCAVCGCTTYTLTPDYSTGEPDFDNPRIVINARLFDDFDLDKVEHVVIDGKNLW